MGRDSWATVHALKHPRCRTSVLRDTCCWHRRRSPSSSLLGARPLPPVPSYVTTTPRETPALLKHSFPAGFFQDRLYICRRKKKNHTNI